MNLPSGPTNASGAAARLSVQVKCAFFVNNFKNDQFTDNFKESRYSLTADVRSHIY